MSLLLLLSSCTSDGPDVAHSADTHEEWTAPRLQLEVVQTLDVVGHDGTFPGLALGDLDGDGLLDLVVSIPRERTVIFLNEGGVLVEAMTLPESVSSALGDLDGDGDLDLVTAGEGQDTIWWNDGSIFLQDVLATDGGISFSVALFDADGDDDLDLSIARYPDGFTPDEVVDGSLRGPGNSLYRNDGGDLVEVALPEAGDVTFLFKPLDVDDDGDLDLLQCNDFGPFLHPSRVLENEGGVFSSTDQVLSTYAMGATLSDVDADGRPDVYVTDIGSPDLMLHGWVEAAASYGVAVPAGDRLTSWGTAFVDLDLDGDDDLVTVFGPLEAGGADLSPLGIDDTDGAEQPDLVLLRDGETFAQVETGFEDIQASRTLVVGDLDRDGAPELIVGGMGSLKVWSVTSEVGGAATVTGPPGTRVQWLDQTRWIEPATTWGQHAPEVVLGMGGAAQIEVAVTPPGGSPTLTVLEAGDRI